MFILANRNIELHTPDRSATHFIPRGFLGDVPDQFCHTPYFDGLVKDGKIVLPATKKDGDVVKAAEAGEKVLDDTVRGTRKPKK